MNIKWILFLIIIHSNPVSLTLPSLVLLENRQTNRLHCLLRNETDTTSTAIVWETSRLDDLEISQYKPNIFHCAIGKDRTCTKYLLNDYWKLDNSLNYNLDTVLDRRWENFEVIKTTKINYKLIDLPEISSDSQIDVFLKTKTNGFVYLCDGIFPPESNCYWITLAGWDHKESIIRKCEHGTIPQYEGIYPEGKCIVKKDSFQDTSFHRLRSINGWNSYKISINNYGINIQNNNNNIINYMDFDQDISISYVFLASLTNSPAQWKINHKPKMYRTGEPNLVHKFQRKDDFSKEKVTISFSIKKIDAVDSFFVQICEKDNVFDGLCYKVIFNDNGRNTICKIYEANCFCRCMRSTRVLWTGFGKTTIWYHLKFINEEDVFTFLRVDEDKVAEFKDENFTANYVFIGSEKMVLWKIHSYDIVTAKKSSEIKFPLYQANKNEYICLAIFVQKTSEANLTLSLNKNESYAFSYYTIEEDNVWEEVRLRTKIVEDVDLYLNVSLISDGNEVFISDIRDCNENDRILEINTTKMMSRELPVCASVRYPEVNIQPRKGFIKKGTIIVKSSEEVDFVWVPNIKDKSFILNYFPVKYVGCNQKVNESNVITKPVIPYNFGTLLYTKLSGLSPFITYNFTILNENERIIIKETIDMLPKEYVEKDDLPMIQTKQDNFNLEVLLSLFDCKKVRGPLFYTLTIEGIDPWNEDFKTAPITKRLYLGTIRHYYKILGYSTYKVTLLFSRDEHFSRNLLRHDLFIPTYPTAPLPTRNVTMHSKTNSSISLRWKTSYPPTGVLENYFIQYWSAKEAHQEVKIDVDSNCTLWHEFICGKINDLTPDTNYTICVVGKNFNSTNLSDCSKLIHVITKEDRPDPPKNVVVSFKDLFMIVNYERPDKSNGPLISSIVTIENRSFMFSIKEEDIKFYSMTINVEEFSAKKLTVGLQVTNLGGVSKSVFTTVNSPPKTPIIKSSGSFQIVNKNIIVFDSLYLEDLDGFSEIFVYVPNHPYDVIDYNCKDLNDAEIYLHTKVAHAKFVKKDQKLNVSLKDRLIYGKHLKALVIIVRNSFEGEERCDSHKFFLKWEQSAHIWLTILILVIFSLVTTAIAFIVYRCYFNDSENIFGHFSIFDLCIKDDREIPEIIPIDEH